ncbi:hypothetical protein [Microbispora sp. NPDC049125]|uniref:hypothetical protein n=1 Tax=Microbispora sp. NPDC049125 TaxID=3154929 RepID=UPI0034661754
MDRRRHLAMDLPPYTAASNAGHHVRYVELTESTFRGEVEVEVRVVDERHNTIGWQWPVTFRGEDAREQAKAKANEAWSSLRATHREDLEEWPTARWPASEELKARDATLDVELKSVGMQPQAEVEVHLDGVFRGRVRWDKGWKMWEAENAEGKALGRRKSRVAAVDVALGL